MPGHNPQWVITAPQAANLTITLSQTKVYVASMVAGSWQGGVVVDGESHATTFTATQVADFDYSPSLPPRPLAIGVSDSATLFPMGWVLADKGGERIEALYKGETGEQMPIALLWFARRVTVWSFVHYTASVFEGHANTATPNVYHAASRVVGDLHQRCKRGRDGGGGRPRGPVHAPCLHF